MTVVVQTERGTLLRALAGVARRPPRWLLLAVLLIAIELAYVFIISAGRFTWWSTWNAQYNRQAEGFRAGHLYIKEAPSPQLLAQPNPYDRSNVALWRWDASLYNGRYYLYWGPLPGLALAAFKSVFRIQRPIGDQYPLFIFYTIHLVSGALLIERMARRLFPTLSLPLVLLAVVVFAFASPTPYMIATPGVYEAAIAGAQAFLLLGLVAAFRALCDAGGERPTGRWSLLGAGVCWALAISCRASAGPPVLALCLLTVLLVPRTSRPWRGRLRDAGWLAGPVTVGVGALLLYNKLRFDDWFEFGITYQLTQPFSVKGEYVPANIYSYLLRPLGFSCQFPYLYALRDIGARGFPSGYHVPAGYSSSEPLAGFWVTTPWTWLCSLGLVLAGRRAVAAARHHSAVVTDAHRRRVSLWCALSFATIGSLTFLPLASGSTPTMRYLADISSGVVLLSTWFAWTTLDLVHHRRWLRRGLVAALVVIALATLLSGLLLGLQGYDEMFATHNPALYHGWQKRLSICRQ